MVTIAMYSIVTMAGALKCRLHQTREMMAFENWVKLLILTRFVLSLPIDVTHRRGDASKPHLLFKEAEKLQKEMKYHDDEYYLMQIARGNQQGFAMLLDKHKDLAFTVALRFLSSREDAEEVVMDAFVKAFKSLGSFKRESKFSTWLYRIVYNTAISRTRKKSLEYTPIDETLTERLPDPDQAGSVNELTYEEKEAFVNSALQSLSPDDALLITFFYKENLPVEEICQITGLSQSNVKVKLHRIRKKMAGMVQDRLSKTLQVVI